MASLVLSVAGSAIGNTILPGAGGALLGSALSIVGASAGGAMDRALFGKETLVTAPRLDSLKVQDSRYGAPMAQVYGRQRLAGQVIWASERMEHVTYEEQGGGKGGGAPRTTYERISYSVHVAVAVCRGPATITRIWADGKLIFDHGWLPGQAAAESSAFYAGDSAQLPDPQMQAMLGVDAVPAYRGVAYVSLFHFPLADYGNRLPNFTFEVEKDVPAAGLEEFFSAFDEGAENTEMARLRGGALLPDGRLCLMGVEEVAPALYRFRAVIYALGAAAPQMQSSVVSANFSSSAALTGARLGMAVSPGGAFVFVGAFTGSPSAPAVYAALLDVAGLVFGEIHQRVAAQEADNLAQYVAPLWLDTQSVIWGASHLVAGAPAYDLYVRGYRALTHVQTLASALAIPAAVLEVNYTPRVFPHPSGALRLQMNGAAVSAEFLSRFDGRLSARLAGTVPLPGAPWQTLYAQTGPEEITLLTRAGGDVSALSLQIGPENVSVTRAPALVLTDPDLSGLSSAVLLSQNRLAFTFRSSSAKKIAELTLSAGGFTLSFGPEAQDRVSDGNTLQRAGVEQLVDYHWQVPTGVAFAQRGQARVSLGAVVRALLIEAGYEAADVVTSDLENVSLTGLLIQDSTSARAVLESLRAFHPFDLIVRDGRLVAQARDGSTAAALTTADLGAYHDGEAGVEILSRSRTPELDLPAEILVSYADAGRDYEPGAQRARRISGAALNVQRLTLPMVLTPDEAKAIAERVLYARWRERERWSFRLPLKFLRLEPGDFITLDGTGLRIEETVFDGTVLEVTAVADDAASLTHTALADSGAQKAQRLALAQSPPHDSQALLLDLPLLRAEDDAPGVYAALGSSGGGWRGGTLYRSLDDVNYTPLFSTPYAAVLGVAHSALGAAVPAYPDRVNRVRLTLLPGAEAGLSGTAEAALLRGANMALLGDELIQFRDVSVVALNVVEISYLLRGRLGTEDAVHHHAAGERFVLLNSALHFTPARVLDLAQSASFKAVSVGHTLGQSASGRFIYGLNTLKPRAPAHVRGLRNGTGDLSISWVRRARLYNDWVDRVDVPLDEPAELYDVQILHSGTVVREFLGVTATTQTYSAAQQTADFGSPQSAVEVRIYQISGRIGRGHAATATL